MLLGTVARKVMLGGWPAVVGYSPTGDLAITSVGTLQTDAYAIGVNTEVAKVTTAGLNAGVRLPVPTGTNEGRVIVHAGASNAVLIYPATGGKINGLAANASLSLAVGKSALCISINATDWAIFISA
jgi:hypothetical protein